MRFILYMFVFCCLAVQGEAKTPFTVAYGDKGTPPYYNGDGNRVPREQPGIVIDLLNMIAKELDLDIKYVRLPWKQVLNSLENNTADAIFDASFNEDRQKLGRYPLDEAGAPDAEKSLYRRSYVLFTKDPGAVEWDGKGLKTDGRAIAAKEGFSILKDLKKYGVPRTEVKSRRIGFGQVKQGKLAGFADLEIEGMGFLEGHKERYVNIHKIRRPLKTKAYFLMISHGFYKRYPELAEKVWQKIPTLLNSKAMRDVRRAYMD